MVKIQQRGLGKGLSALIQEPLEPKTPTEHSSRPGAHDLPVAMLIPGKFQPRTVFNEEALRELSESIKKNGLVQPIIVRDASTASRKLYEIIAGERRWRAARMAGLASVPVIIRALTDQQALEIALIENIQRADLNPLEEAAGYQRLLEEVGYTQEELSVVVAKSRSHIANMLRLLTLPQHAQEHVKHGRLTMGHARALIGLPTEKADAIMQAIIDRGLSVRQAENLARAEHGALRKPYTRRQGSGAGDHADKDPDILALETTLSENIGMPVTINDQGQSGEVTIAYNSLSQLDSILQRLGGGV